MELGSSMFSVARKAGGWVYGLVERWICGRAYEISTRYQLHRELVEARLSPLGEHLVYQILWQEYSHRARQRTPSIEVRATTAMRLSKVVISVSASNDKASYQDEIVLRRVDQRRHRAALPAVPFRNLEIKGGSVYTPYDELRVELVEIRDEGGMSLLPSRPVVAISHPVDRLEVTLGTQQDYVERWRRVYNLRLIEMEITEELVRIAAWRFYRTGAARALTEPLQSRRVAKLLFWLKNAVRAKPLQAALNQHIAEYEEYLAHRKASEQSAALVE